MITVEDKEQIRRAYYIEHKSIRQIHRETGCHRRTIRNALSDGLVPQYSLKESRPEPVLSPVKDIIDQERSALCGLRRMKSSHKIP